MTKQPAGQWLYLPSSWACLCSTAPSLSLQWSPSAPSGYTSPVRTPSSSLRLLCAWPAYRVLANSTSITSTGKSFHACHSDKHLSSDSKNVATYYILKVSATADGIPIVMRLINSKNFVRGPFSLGFMSPIIGVIAVLWICFITVSSYCTWRVQIVCCAFLWLYRFAL